MSRKRMTWKERQASPPPATPGYEEYWGDDPHPAAKPDAGPDDYLIGDGTPSTFAEDVHPGPYENSAPPAMPTEDGDHPATKRANDEKLLRSLERKASKCIKIAEHTLGPFAPDQAVEDHSLALMELPGGHIDTTLNTILAAEEEVEEEVVEDDEDTDAKKKASEDKEAEGMLREMMAEEDDDDDKGKEAFDRLASELKAELAGIRGDVSALKDSMEPVVVDEDEMLLESMMEEEAAKGCQSGDCGDPAPMSMDVPMMDDEQMMLDEMDDAPMMDDPMMDDAPMMDDEQMMLDEMRAEEEDQNDPEAFYTGEEEIDETESMLQEMLSADQDEEADEDSDKEAAEEEEVVEEEEEDKEAAADHFVVAEDPMGLLGDDDNNNLTAEDSDLLGQLFNDKLAADDEDGEEEEEEEVEVVEEDDEEEVEVVEEDDEEKEKEKEKEAKKKKKAALKPKPRRSAPEVTSLGHMKTASQGRNEIDELSSLWATDPDVSDVFKS